VPKQFCQQRFLASEVRGKILVCDAQPSAGGSSATTVASVNFVYTNAPASDWPRAIIVLITLDDIGLGSPDLLNQATFSPNLPLPSLWPSPMAIVCAPGCVQAVRPAWGFPPRYCLLLRSRR